MTIKLKPNQTIRVTGDETIQGTTGDTIRAYGSYDAVTLSGSHMTFIGSDAGRDRVAFLAGSSYNTVDTGANTFVDFGATSHNTVNIGRGEAADVRGIGNIGSIVVAKDASSVAVVGDSPQGNYYQHYAVTADLTFKGVSQKVLNADVAAAKHFQPTASTNLYTFSVGATSVTIEGSSWGHVAFHAG